MKLLKESQARKIYETFCKKFGASDDEAATFADMVVQADLRGFDGQGIVRLNHHYLRLLRNGTIKPGSKITVIKDTPSMALLDGGRGLGQVIGTKAMELAIEKAKKSGVGVVSIRNSSDWGMTSYYSMKALKHDCIGITMAVASAALVAPWGGCDRIFGTNPFSYSIPAGKHWPIVLDMATAASSASRIFEAMIHGRSVPEGLILDSSGRSTTDPREFIDSSGSGDKGVLMSFGPRGYGLLTMVEIFGGALSGGSFALDGGRGQFCMAIDINQFTPITEFKRKVDQLIDRIKSSRLANSFSEILLPGEKEYRVQQKRTKEGIPVPDTTWEEINRVARELDIDLGSVIEGTTKTE